jgi:UDP-glucose 6-dehydrogenase
MAPADEKARKWSAVVLDLLPKGDFQSFYSLDSTQAEVVKYAINRFGALKVTFFNMLYDLCQEMSANFEGVRVAVVRDARIGSSWSDPLHGGIRGYNGFCFPKDTKAILFEDQEILRRKEKDMGPVLETMRWEASVLFWRVMDHYNEILHRCQGTTVAAMSVHDSERKKRIKKLRERG